MVARNRIHCTVVAVPASSQTGKTRGALARDVLPWADPYVAQLIKNLQDEVRSERRMRSLVRHYRAELLDAFNTQPQSDFEFGDALDGFGSNDSTQRGSAW